MKLRVGIIGPGSLGTVAGAALKAAGHAVVLFGRPERVAGIREKGLIVSGLMDLYERVEAVADPTEMGAVDLLVVCTKGLDTRRLLEPFRGLKVDVVLSLQNGVLKNLLLADVFGPDKVLGAATMIAAERQSDGRVYLTNLGMTYVGELPERCGPDRAGTVAAALREAGLPCEVPGDILSVEWSKACNAVAIFSTGTLSRLDIPDVYLDPDLAGLFLDLNREVAEVAGASGVAVGDYAGFPIHFYVTAPREESLEFLRQAALRLKKAPKPVKASMLQDALAGRPLEVEEVHGHIAAEAARLGVEVPRLNTCYRLLRGLSRHLGY